jgi:hypothetical protein
MQVICGSHIFCPPSLSRWRQVMSGHLANKTHVHTSWINLSVCAADIGRYDDNRDVYGLFFQNLRRDHFRDRSNYMYWQGDMFAFHSAFTLNDKESWAVHVEHSVNVCKSVHVEFIKMAMFVYTLSIILGLSTTASLYFHVDERRCLTREHNELNTTYK